MYYTVIKHEGIRDYERNLENASSRANNNLVPRVSLLPASMNLPSCSGRTVTCN